MNRARKLISFLGHTKGTCTVLGGMASGRGREGRRGCLPETSTELLFLLHPEEQPALMGGRALELILSPNMTFPAPAS